MFKKAILFIILSTFSATLLAGCKGAAEAPATPPTIMIVEEVTLDNVSATSRFVGRVEAAVQAAITARVSGFLEQKSVTAGEQVTEGQLLLVIEKAQYQTAVAQARAALSQARANLKNAELQKARSDALVESASISRAAYDNVVAAYEVAKAAELAADASLKSAELNLSYTDVRSPISGQVGIIVPNIGETVSPSTGVITRVIASSPMYVNFNVSDKQMQDIAKVYLKDGENVSQLINEVSLNLILPNGASYNEVGKLNFINNAVSVDTDAIALRGEFANVNGLLEDGQTVTVELQSNTPVLSIVVPQASVLKDVGGSYVYIAGEGNTLVRKDVIPGTQISGSRQVITSGLAEGDRVVVEGVQKYRPGAPVQPMTKAEYDGMMKSMAEQAPQNGEE